MQTGGIRGLHSFRKTGARKMPSPMSVSNEAILRVDYKNERRLVLKIGFNFCGGSIGHRKKDPRKG